METETPVELPSINTPNKTSIMKWIIIVFGLITLGFMLYNYYATSKGNIAETTESTISSGLEDTETDLKEGGDELEHIEEEVGGDIEELSKEIGSGVENVGKGAENVISEVGHALDIHVKNRETGKILMGDTNDSSIQMPKKTGFCYIGEDRGTRSCMYVGKRDTCMSGDIFPSMDICINPNLRA